MESNMTERVSATPAAVALIEQLTAQHGPIVFFQSGGCCEGSGPMCLPAARKRYDDALTLNADYVTVTMCVAC